MSRYYVTFGQTHAHRVNGKTFDKDCVAVFNLDVPIHEAREEVFRTFSNKWCFMYTQEQIDAQEADTSRGGFWQWFPRGAIEVYNG